MHYKKLNTKSGRFIAAVTFVSLFTIVFTALRTAPSQSITGSTTTECHSGFSLMLPTSSTITGTVNVALTIPNNITMPVTAAELRSNDLFIGRLQQNNTYNWSLPWMTALFAGPTAKTAYLSAYVYSGSTLVCNTHPINVNVYNSTTLSLATVLSPSTWQGPVGSSQLISAVPKISNSTYDIRPYAKTTWRSTIGNVIANDANNAQFTAGFTVGTGSIVAKSEYGGAVAVFTTPVKVLESSAPLPTTMTSTNNTTTQTTTTSTAKTPTSTTSTATTPGTTTQTSTAQTSTQVTQANTTAQECLLRVLGDERYKAINTKADRPTAAEIEKMNPCFAVSNYIMPANFSPVEPSKQNIHELDVSKQIAIAKLENVTNEKNASATVDGLKISGTTKPNSRVLVYVFSDPLVLTTTADANGNWTYTLEDPLEPGNHEVYSVVDRGDGVYQRSAPVSFVIATAEAASTNPQGLSLKLADTKTPKQSDSGLVVYLAAAFGMILLVGIGFVGLLYLKNRWARRKTNPTPEQTGAITSQNTPEQTTGETTVQPSFHEQTTQKDTSPTISSESSAQHPSDQPTTSDEHETLEADSGQLDNDAKPEEQTPTDKV